MKIILIILVVALSVSGCYLVKPRETTVEPIERAHDAMNNVNSRLEQIDQQVQQLER